MDAKQVLALMKEKDVKFVDFRFTDPRGKWQHTARMASATDEDTFTDGVMFDGSSIAGWKAINESDMVLMPDPTSAHLDPFYAQTTLAVFCDILEPSTGEGYARDPRMIAKRTEAYLKSTGIGDTVFVGPEAEFFIFDDVKFAVTPYNTGFKLDSVELPSNSDRDYDTGNMGHRMRTRRRTCAPRCCRPWATWASSSRSTTTRWPPPSMNSAPSSSRWSPPPTTCRSTST